MPYSSMLFIGLAPTFWAPACLLVRSEVELVRFGYDS